MAKIAGDVVGQRQERANRIRIGVTGLAFIIVIVLLAASFSGTASNEPELTPEAIAEQQAQNEEGAPDEEEQRQEPLAELGVGPRTGPNPEAETAEDETMPPLEEPAG